MTAISISRTPYRRRRRVLCDHVPAGLGAIAARLRAALAMLHRMLRALLGTGIADFGAQAAKVL